MIKKFKIAVVVISLFIMSVFCIYGDRLLQELNVYHKMGEGITVSFIDVGKADAIHINADGYNFLIDAGAENDARAIVAYLDRYSIDTLDMVIQSHPDIDHIGGMNTVIENYQVNKYLAYDIDEEYVGSNTTYDALKDTLRENNVEVEYVSAGDVFDFGKLKLKVISPDHEYKDANNDSLVVKAIYGSKKFLFTGDISDEVEKYLVDNKADVSCDVLKVAHHGSKNGTTLEFLELANPEYAIICVGENTNSLPGLKTLKNLQEFGVEIYRTDICGNIVVSSDGEKLKVSTEK